MSPVPASIVDVAARAGVSPATVSRALRGLPNVRPDTRERVQAAARALHYVANPNASRLAAGRTAAIGVIVPMFTRWFFTQVVAGAEKTLASAGYDIVLYTIGRDDSRARFVQQLQFRRAVDGVIVVDVPLSDAEQDALVATGTPAVTVGLPHSRLPSVCIDNVAAARTATRHLLNLGHTQIAFVSGQPHDVIRFSAPTERRRGWQQALRQDDVTPRDDLEVSGNFSLAGGAHAMAQLLALSDPPTAVFAGSDEMALGALKTLVDSGLHVPRDVSVIGFDDHEVAEFFGLTTMYQPVARLGEVAAELLLHVMGGAADARDQHVVLPTALRMRATTGPVAERPAHPPGHRAVMSR